MADNSKKISELSIVTNIAGTDRVLVLRNPSSNAYAATVTVSNLFANVTISNNAPATSTTSGVAGAIRFDSDYIYVCVANNVWKRSPLTTW